MMHIYPCPPSLCSAKMVLELLKKEVELCKLQQDIREQVRLGRCWQQLQCCGTTQLLEQAQFSIVSGLLFAVEYWSACP